MKFKLLVAALAVAAFTGGAAAQTASNWSGLYVGGHAGADSTTHDIAAFNESVEQFSGAFIPNRGIVIVPGTTTPVGASRLGSTRFVGGGQAGYAFAFDHVVLGVEGDVTFGNLSSTSTATGTLPTTAIESPANLTVTRTVNSNMGWSVRARAGYAWDNLLVYATGGIAGSNFKVSGFDTFANAGGLSANCAPTPCQSTSGPVTNTTAGALSNNRTGWAFGGGGELDLGGGFSIGMEYRHNDFGGHTFALPTTNVSVTVPAITAPAGATTTGATPPRLVLSPTRVDFTDDALTMRLNLHL